MEEGARVGGEAGVAVPGAGHGGPPEVSCGAPQTKHQHQVRDTHAAWGRSGDQMIGDEKTQVSRLKARFVFTEEFNQILLRLLK